MILMHQQYHTHRENITETHKKSLIPVLPVPWMYFHILVGKVAGKLEHWHFQSVLVGAAGQAI